MSRVRLSELIQTRLDEPGVSTRTLARRATDAGYPLSHSTIATYANRSKLDQLPNERTRRALAVALGVSFEAVNVAALESASDALGMDGFVPDATTLHRAEAWLCLTADRTDEEVSHLLGVVRKVIEGITKPPDTT